MVNICTMETNKELGPIPKVLYRTRKDVWYMQELEQLIRKLKILEFKFIFFKLPKKEQLLYLKEYCRKKYDLEEPLPEHFYELLLTSKKRYWIFNKK